MLPPLLVWIRKLHRELDDGELHLHRKYAHFANRLSRNIMSLMVYTPWLYRTRCALIFPFKSNEENLKETNDIMCNKELSSLQILSQ